MSGVRLDAVEQAVAELAAGRPVVVVDDEDRENEADLIVAADGLTQRWTGFLVRWTSGLLCVPMPEQTADRLGLPMMVERNEESLRTAYTVTVDAREGVSTGISAADRTRTARLLADPATTAEDLVRPGHMLPLRARAGGVLARRGHTEAAVDLARLAGREPVGVLAELVHDDGSMMRAVAARDFADEHRLVMISIDDLVRYRRRHETSVDRVASTRLPTRHGLLTAHGYADRLDGAEHLALVAGDVSAAATGDEPVLVRIHSECLTGDVLGSQRCDCGPQLDAALDRVVEAGRGVVVYLRGHEGRGIGLLAKLQAYALQDAGLDTVDANLELGLPADAREYAAAAQVLADLGVRRVRLMTNNPDKVGALARYGVDVVERVPIAVGVGPENVRYLRTKRDRMGHDIPGLEVKA